MFLCPMICTVAASSFQMYWRVVLAVEKWSFGDICCLVDRMKNGIPSKTLCMKSGISSRTWCVKSGIQAGLGAWKVGFQAGLCAWKVGFQAGICAWKVGFQAGICAWKVGFQAGLCAQKVKSGISSKTVQGLCRVLYCYIATLEALHLELHMISQGQLKG